MKILHIVAHAFRGGCEKNCFYLCEGASSFAHEVLVLGREGPMTAAWRNTGATVEHLDILNTNLFVFLHRLQGLLRNRKYEYVMLWSTIRLPLQLHAVGAVTGKIRVHLGNPLSKHYRSSKDMFLRFMFKETGGVKLVACSAYVAESHRTDDYFGKFEIKVSLNPVALPLEMPAKQLDPDFFRMGMVARLDPIKDHRCAILAFEQLKPHVPQAQLHLLGDGILRDELTALVKSKNLECDIFFHGDVDNVYEYLNTWDLFVYATTAQEGLGSAVAEAMANGLPCLLSDLPMMRELAPADGIVQFCRAGDSADMSIQAGKLYKNKELRNQLGKAAFAHASKTFGVKRYLQDYLN